MIKVANEDGHNHVHMVYDHKAKETRMSVHLDVVYDRDDVDVAQQVSGAVQQMLAEMSAYEEEEGLNEEEQGVGP